MLTLQEFQYLLMCLTGITLIIYYIAQHIWFMNDFKWLIKLFWVFIIIIILSFL
jgi:hypothetical protein